MRIYIHIKKRGENERDREVSPCKNAVEDLFVAV